MQTLAQPKLARVLFDESHSEAWTIRPELAEQMQPAHPADSSYAIAAGELGRPRLRRHRATPTARSTRETLAGADVARHRPPLRPEVGGDHQRAARPPSATTRSTRSRPSSAAAAGSSSSARPSRTSTATTSTSSSPASASRSRTPPSRTTSTHHGAPSLGARDLADGSPTATGPTALRRLGRGPHSVDLLARVHEACFYRAGTLALHNGASPRPHLPDRVAVRARPLAAVARARRRPRRRPRRLRPLRRRLHRRARPRGPLAEPRLLGRPARLRPALQTVTDSPAAADPPLGRAQGGRRGAAR